MKVRGHLIEVAEIETALLACPSVREAVVTAREDQPGAPRLVAYVVPDGHPEPSVSELGRALRDRLPHHMVPAAFVILDALPLTPGGKVDRRALPDAQGRRPALDVGFVAPRTPTEEALASI